MENVKIIGTSHIAAQSIAEIKKYIFEEKPEIVAVELDVQRAATLFEETKRKVSLADAFKVGFKGYLFARVGQYIQQKLGKMVGVAPGSEMKTALELARKHNLEVAFIDQPIQITLRNFSRELTWKEKWRFAADMVKGLLFPKRQLRELGLQEFDLKKVPAGEVIEKMMGQLRKRYPNVYKTLVEDRNKYMVRKIIQLRKENSLKKILVVVGAGHQRGMEEILRKVDVIR